MTKLASVIRLSIYVCISGAAMHVSVVQAQSIKPNVLFIAIDDLVPTLGCYGDTTAITPEIDSLAGQGMTFLNHHCVWSVCGPSRVALSTSLTPEETGVTGFKAMRHPDFLPDVITMPQHFKNNGYETACTGKYHDNRTVGDTTQPLVDNKFPDGSNVDDPASWSIAYIKAASGFSTPKASDGIHVAYDDTDQADSNYGDHKILTEGEALITTLSAGCKPFFLAVGFKKPHLAFVAPKRMWDKYTRSAMPLASFTSLPINVSATTQSALENNGELKGYADPVADAKYPAPLNLSDDQQRALIHGYYACTSWVDYLVGQLLDKLAVTDDPVQIGKKMSETTIVVIWGDHGFHLGDHGRWAKHSVSERATSCPLIVFDPRSPNNGAKTNSPISTLDIFPTLCELAALPIPLQPMDNTPGSTGRPLRGRSFVPVLNDPNASVNIGAVNVFQRDSSTGYSYRTERFRYIEWVKNNTDVVVGSDLYDYTLDPLETKNLVDDPAYAAIVYQLSRAMRAETSTQGAIHLQASGPVSTGNTSYIPFIRMESGGGNASILRWPSVGGQTFNVLSNTDLVSAWPDFVSNLVGDQYSYTIPANESRRFFRVAIGSNTPPRWYADPLVKANASKDSAYVGSLSADATDPDAGSSLTFSKISGPAWLSVAPDGILSGSPTVASADYFRVQVSDEFGASTLATLQISVVDSTPTQTDTFTASDDTYAKEADVTLVPGNKDWIELRKLGGSSSERVGYLKFNVTGVGTIQSAKLFLHSDTESDSVNALTVSDTNWIEGALNWTYRPATGSVVGNATATPGAWFSIDVSSYITGNGNYSIALDEQGNSFGKLHSKEGGFAPYLEIIWN